MSTAPSIAATPKVVLPAELSIAEAPALRGVLLAALADSGPGSALPVDGSPVEAVDGAGLSLLCALAADLRARGAVLALGDASEPLVAAARLAGAAELLGLEPA